MLLIWVQLRLMALSYPFIWDKFLCLLILSFSVCFCVLGKSASPVLEENCLTKKRSCSVLPYGVHCFPGPGASESVSTVCCLCSAVLFWPLYLSGHLSAEAFFACCGHGLVPGFWLGVLWSVRDMRLLSLQLEQKLCKFPCWEVQFEQGFELVFWGKGTAVLGLRQVWLGEGGFRWGTGLGLGLSILSSECGYSTASCSWPWAYANGCGREMASQFLCSCSGLSWMLSLWDVLSDEQITPQVLSGSLFPHTLWIVCLPSLQELHSALWALTQPSPLILKTPGIKPQKFQEIMKFGPSHFSRQLLGGGGGCSFSLVLPVC